MDLPFGRLVGHFTHGNRPITCWTGSDEFKLVVPCALSNGAPKASSSGNSYVPVPMLELVLLSSDDLAGNVTRLGTQQLLELRVYQIF